MEEFNGWIFFISLLTSKFVEITHMSRVETVKHFTEQVQFGCENNIKHYIRSKEVRCMTVICTYSDGLLVHG